MVGTTVTRALETGQTPTGRCAPAPVGPISCPARVVDGLVTGWHDPRAFHLLLLEAVAGARLAGRAYAAAAEWGYW